jgi:outer membrane protein assembly factor BamB
LGWGADKGVVIVEHTFRGGRRLLSFYGHLDPPSVVLRAGQCIERGDQVGAIGDPRTSPHLHFEIRVHLPDTPGPGYWPSDPRRAGWRPPSATIWFERMAALPGVRWAHLHNDGFLLPLGVVDGNALVSAGAGELLALDMDDGGGIWSQSLPQPAEALLLDAHSRLIYSAAPEGKVEAYSTSALERGESEAPLWSLDLGEAGIPSLAPLPGGGLIVSTRSALLGVSLQGEVLWRSAPAQGIVDWVESGAAVVMLTRQGMWRIDREQAVLWPVSVNGQKIIASDEPFIYSEDGLYRLNFERQTAELFFALPRGFPRSGDLAELPGGGLLVVHADPADTRLIAIEEDGSLRWERSVEGLGARTVELLAAGGQVYAAMQLDLGSSTGIEVFHVQTQDGRLTRVFSGGTRSASSNPADFTVVGDSILISIADVGLLAWEPQLALQTVLEGLPPDE